MLLRLCSYNKILFSLSVFALFFILNPSVASSEIYTVKKGDTLYKISKKFNIEVEKIKDANALDSVNLKPGAELTIPGSASPKQHETQYHTVKKGETLVSISRKYSISVKDLKGLNAIKKSAKLKPGKQLIVRKAGPKTHTVKRGETIWRIAKKYGMDVDELMLINELESYELKSGQTLLLEAKFEEPDSSTNSEVRLSEDINALSESQQLNSLGVKDRLMLFAKKMLDIPYRFGGSSFMGIDCSGYVQKVFGFLDVPLPRTAREQFHIGESVTREDLSIGDLVFFRTYASFPSHVGIYLGNNLFIHASSRSKKVSIDSLDTPYYFKRFIGAKRLFNDEINENVAFKEKG